MPMPTTLRTQRQELTVEPAKVLRAVLEALHAIQAVLVALVDEPFALAVLELAALESALHVLELESASCVLELAVPALELAVRALELVVRALELEPACGRQVPGNLASDGLASASASTQVSQALPLQTF